MDDEITTGYLTVSIIAVCLSSVYLATFFLISKPNFCQGGAFGVCASVHSKKNYTWPTYLIMSYRKATTSSGYQKSKTAKTYLINLLIDFCWLKKIFFNAKNGFLDQICKKHFIQNFCLHNLIDISQTITPIKRYNQCLLVIYKQSRRLTNNALLLFS